MLALTYINYLFVPSPAIHYFAANGLSKFGEYPVDVDSNPDKVNCRILMARQTWVWDWWRQHRDLSTMCECGTS